MATTGQPTPVGQRYGELTVLAEGTPHYTYGRNGRTQVNRRWLVRYDCGREVELLATNVRNGRQLRCGGHGRKRIPGITPITYSSMHKRIRYKRGRASEYACTICGSEADQWAYLNSCEEEVQAWTPESNMVLRYCEHVDHYAPMCKKDHKRFDNAEREARNDEV